MKLSDIFKLDLNTGGGNKLFARIMNKYNVPKKEYENVKQEMNSFSGGGDSGSNDVEYWKIINIDSDVEHTIEDLLSYSTLTVFEDGSIGPIYLVTKGYRVNANPLKLVFIPIYLDEYINSLKILFIRVGLNPDDYLIPITKEEFYDLNNI